MAFKIVDVAGEGDASALIAALMTSFYRRIRMILSSIITNFIM